MLAFVGFDITGIIIAAITALGAMSAAILPVLIIAHRKGNKVANTLGESNGQGTVVEMLERQGTRQERHGELLSRLIDGQARQDERLFNLELGHLENLRYHANTDDRIKMMEKEKAPNV